MWRVERETEEELNGRVNGVMGRLFAEREQVISVTSHSGVIRNMIGMNISTGGMKCAVIKRVVS